MIRRHNVHNKELYDLDTDPVFRHNEETEEMPRSRSWSWDLSRVVTVKTILPVATFCLIQTCQS